MARDMGGRGGVRRATTWCSAAAVLCGALAVSLTASGASAALRQAKAPSNTVWLCRPGMANDPCTANLTSTTVSATGATKVVMIAPNPTSKFDCFYVYPTVSPQEADNANLKVQPAETATAVAQASKFSQVCRVWAPMYRQITVPGLARGLSTNRAAGEVAYQSLLSGWKDYLAHHNDGRPIIFIGHSQGAALLIELLHNVIDPSAKLRHQMVSAIILGGNVQVPVGKDVGGSFTHIPTCGSPGAIHCVIAYSSFGSTPPAASFFGRPGQGVSLQSDQTASAGQQVACVNPVTLSSGSGSLEPYFPSASTKVPGVAVSTPWVSFPALYSATCMSSGGATWLQVTRVTGSADPRPTVTAALGPDWGYHLDDVNLALGNLVLDVALQEEAAH